MADSKTSIHKGFKVSFEGFHMVFPQFTRHFLSRTLTLPLELMGAELIEVLMASNTIVETLDVIEDF